MHMIYKKHKYTHKATYRVAESWLHALTHITKYLMLVYLKLH